MSPADRLIQTMQMMNQTLCCGNYGFFLEPSGERVSMSTAHIAIKSGLLKANNDGLFGVSQTWRYVGEEKT